MTLVKPQDSFESFLTLGSLRLTSEAAVVRPQPRRDERQFIGNAIANGRTQSLLRRLLGLGQEEADKEAEHHDDRGHNTGGFGDVQG
jgi:hypothetical protein